MTRSTIRSTILATMTLAVILAAMPCAAQKLPTLAPEAVRFSTTTLERAAVPVRSWIVAQAETAYASKLDPGALRGRLAQSIPTRFAGQKVSDLDVEALVALVSFEVAKAAHDDIAQQLATMERTREEREKLRELHRKLAEELARNGSTKGTALCTASVCITLRASLMKLATSQAEAGIRSPIAPVDARTFAELQAAVEHTRSKLDSLSELSEEQQLRMQALMDRLAKFDAAMSAIMKKFSETQSQIIQNLK